jgi:hypothetical protein
MSKDLAKSPRLPKEVRAFFDDLPLVRDESREQYEALCLAIADNLRATDIVSFSYVRDYVYYSFEIRRERQAKTEIIALATREVVLDLIKSTYQGDRVLVSAERIFSAADEAKQWELDPKARDKINARLAAHGYTAARVQAMAYVRGADQINTFDRRIASYETRQIALVREIGRYNEALARKLVNASHEIIDADFTEAAE